MDSAVSYSSKSSNKAINSCACSSGNIANILCFAEALQSQKAREDAAKQRIFAILTEEQAQELISLFDEFEEYETAESKFAHAMDNIQPLILNNSNNGGDWREHDVTVEQIYKRQSKTKLGSEKLFEITDCIIQENVKKGNLKY